VGVRMHWALWFVCAAGVQIRLESRLSLVASERLSRHWRVWKTGCCLLWMWMTIEMELSWAEACL